MKYHTKISVIILVAILVITLSVILAFRGEFFPEQKELKEISISVSRTPLSAPFYVADKLGLFKANGLKVDLIEVIGGKKSFDNVMSDKTDYGTSSESVLMFGGLAGEKYYNLASFVESDNDIKILVNSPKINTGIASLKGKKIGIIKGSASEYFLSLLLALNHLDINDFKLEGIAPNKMLDALANNDVAAVVTWEPYAFEIKKSLGEKVELLNEKGLYTLYFNLVTTQKYAQANFETNKQLLSALSQAIEFITDDPKKTKALLMESLNLKEDFIDWIWPDYLYNLSLNRSLLLTIEDEARWATQSGLSKTLTIPDFQSFIYPEPLSQINKSAIGL